MSEGEAAEPVEDATDAKDDAGKLPAEAALPKITVQQAAIKPAELEVPEDLDEHDRAVWHFLHELHTLMKALMLHDSHHSMAMRAAEIANRAIHQVGLPFSVQFVASGVFVERSLVPVDFMHYGFVEALTRSLNRLKAHELNFDEYFTAEGALQLGIALAGGFRGQTDMLRNESIRGLSWRNIPNATSGVDAAGVDPEVAAVTHTILALNVAEQIVEAGDVPWPWPQGLSVVNRLEKAIKAKPGVSMRVVEFAPDGWNRVRRAVSAAQLVLEVLIRVGASSAHRRAAAHAALALGLEGLAERGGLRSHEAATRLEQRILRNPVQARSGVAPQCLLVATLVHLMTPAMRERKDIVALGVTDLIELTYQMERERSPENVSFELGRADLLASALDRTARTGTSYWVRAMIMVCGAVPVGAFVQLADGRCGTVIEPGPAHDPWRPVVFIDGHRVVPNQPVMLIPPNKRRRVA